MCGRYTLFTISETLGNLFRVVEVPKIQPRFNIAPTQQVPVVRLSPDGEREMVTLRWGLIPFWSREPFVGRQLINARSETVDKRLSFREPFKHRRCLIPADGFYEWKSEPKEKQPYYISMFDDNPFAFAGLWEHWEGAEGDVIESCTILTTRANEFIITMHDRMPVIIDPTNYDLWLEPNIQEREPLALLMEPYPEDSLTAIPVTTWVNNPRNDDGDCIKPLKDVTE